MQTGQRNPGRRSFLKLVGGVLGSGVGLTVAGGAASAAPAVHGKGDNGVNCAIYCSVAPYGCRGCSVSGQVATQFLCTNSCDGSRFYSCRVRVCSGFCLSQSAC